MDTLAVQDADYRPRNRDDGPHGCRRGHRSGGGGPGRRTKGYRRLFDAAMGRSGDFTHGRHPEMSVEELVKLARALPPNSPTVAAVTPSLSFLDSRALAAFLKELAKVGQAVRSLEVFDWLRGLPSEHELAHLCDVYTYTTAISLMSASQQLRRALELVGEMRSRGLACNVHTYSALMNVCIKCDACELALDVFQQMHADNVQPNVVTYNTLVDVYGKTGAWDKAVRVLDDMREQGLEPEVRTYNTAIIACNMCNQPGEALQVYERLLEAGLAPSATTYTALISAHSKSGQLDKALEVFTEMVAQRCERSIITYSTLISSCEKAGRWELALQLYDRMHADGCTPNSATFNALITACQQGGQSGRAMELYDAMRSAGCRPDVATYSALIGAHVRTGTWRQVLGLLDAMQTSGCKPDSLVYTNAIDALWATGVTWAQARAAQLHAAAARTWQYRFTVQPAGAAAAGSSSGGGGGGGGGSGGGSTGTGAPTAASLAPLTAAAARCDAALEYVVPGPSAGVALLALRRWLTELTSQVAADPLAALAGAGCPSSADDDDDGAAQVGGCLVLSIGRGRGARSEQCGGSSGGSGSSGSSAASTPAAAAVLEVLQGFGSPFRAAAAKTDSAAADPAATSSNTVVAVSPLPALLSWLSQPELPARLALLPVPAPAAPPSGAVLSRAPGAGRKPAYSVELADDAALEHGCIAAFTTVRDFEACHAALLWRDSTPTKEPAADVAAADDGHESDDGGLSAEYLQERPALAAAAFALGDQLQLAEEVPADALLLLDLVMAAGTEHVPALGSLMVAGALRLAALQMVPQSDAAALSALPSDALLCAAVGFPAGSVTRMEANLSAALGGAPKAISALRSLKLFLERLGCEQQGSSAVAHVCQGMLRLLRSAMLEPALLRTRPSLLALAVLVAARRAVGAHPVLPGAIAQLMGLQGDAVGAAELTAPLSLLEPLLVAADLHPPAHCAPATQVALASVVTDTSSHGYHVLSGGSGSQQLCGSGQSSPLCVGTPPGCGGTGSVNGRLLLDSMARQASLQRVGSELSTLSMHTASEAGSVAELSASLLPMPTTAAAMYSMSGCSPVQQAGCSLSGSPGLLHHHQQRHGDEPATLAATMAGLQLGAALAGPHPILGSGGPSLPAGYLHQPLPHNSTTTTISSGGAAGSWMIPPPTLLPSSSGTMFDGDAYRQAALLMQHQHAAHAGSRLAQMTNPFITPVHQHATMLNGPTHHLMR